MANGTIILGSLDDKALQSAIDKLAKDVDTKMGGVAKKFDDNIQLMQASMQTFADRAKVMSSGIKNTFAELGTTYDDFAKAMQKAAQATTKASASNTANNTGGGTALAHPDTLGALKQQISEMEKLLEQQKLYSTSLQQQVDQLKKQKDLYKEMTTDTATKSKQTWQSDFKKYNQPVVNNLAEAERKLNDLQMLQKKWSGNIAFTTQEQIKLNNAIAKAQKEVERFRKPTWDSVMGMDESSIDAITKKMTALKSVTIDPNNKAQVKTLNDEYQRLAQRQQELMGRNAALTSSNNGLARSFGYIRNRVVFALTLGAMGQFVRNLYEIRSQYELLERSLGVLTNSFQRGSEIFQQLNAMAMESPFTTLELAGAAKQLTAYDFKAEEVVETTRRLADISAALGVPMERLTYNLGQIRAQTVLTARDARDFANAGLPIVKSLADYYSELEGRIVSTGDVYERMSKKMVSYNDVISVLNKMTDEDGKFYNFQAKQAETLRVQINNLTLAMNNMFNEMGQKSQTVLTFPIRALKTLFKNWQTVSNVLVAVVAGLGAYKTAMMVSLAVTGQMTVATKAFTVVINGLRKAILAISAHPFVTAITAITAALTYLWMRYRDVSESQKELNESIRKNAADSVKSLEEFITNKGSREARNLAEQGKLSAEEAAKAWEGVVEQLKNSTSSASGLVVELENIENVNERAAKGFSYLEKIERVQRFLSNMPKDYVSTNKNAIGDNIGEDTKELYDYLQFLRQYPDAYKKIADESNNGIDIFDRSIAKVKLLALGFRANSIASSECQNALTELNQEAENTAQSIAKIIEVGDFKDKIEVNEIIETIRKNIKLSSPELTGEVGDLFDLSLDKALKKSLKDLGVEFDNTETIYKKFFEKLAEYRSKVSKELNEGITDVSKPIPKDVKEIIDEVIGELGFYSKQADKLINDSIDTEEFRRRLADFANIDILDDLQKAFSLEFLTPKGIKDGTEEYQKEIAKLTARWGEYQKRDSENYIEWEKRLQDELKKSTDAVSEYERVLKELEDEMKGLSDKQKGEDNRYKSTTESLEREKGRVEDLTTAMKFFHMILEEMKKTGSGSKKDILGEAIKDELRIITDMQKRYKEYMKIGVGSTEAMNKAVSEYGSTLEKVNKTLSQFGFKTLTPPQIANMPLQEIKEFYQNQLLIAKEKGSVAAIEALEKAIASLNVEITKTDYKTIIEGLNSELGKIKDEYELGVELDASPELGQAFADIFKIDIDQLPRTVYDAFRHVEHAVQGALSSLGIKDSFNVMTDSLEDFAKKYERDLGSDFISAIKKIQETIRGMWKKETSDTIKDWDNLLNKYGDFQTKLMKISKDSAKEQLSIIKRFGSTEDKSEAQIIVDNISISQDPAQIEVLRKQLLDILNKVVTDKDVAIKIKTASSKEESSLISKAYWEDFKNSELYSMTFEEMDRVSTRAIKDILAQLDILKDKVKEDPASMKALMDAYKKGRDELEKRSPFMAIGESLKEWAEASKEVKAANEAYTQSMKEMNDAEREYQTILERNNMLQSMGEYGVSAEDLEETAEAQEKLNKAKKKAKKSKENLTDAENKEISAQHKFQNALGNSASALQSMGGALSTVMELMGIAEDSELGVMVNSLIGGFQTMATVLGLVATMAQLVQLSFGWIGAIMIALVGLIALVKFLADIKDFKINQEIKESENTVKSLELQYKKLQYAIEDAFGVAKSGAQAAAAENKKLQLAEIERQIALEKSRSAKKMDFEKIRELEEQYLELSNEIKNDIKDITNELSGIQSVGDAAEDLVSSMIDAFKSGEDYMQVFEESFDKMIDNMIMKAIVSKVIGPQIEKMFENVEAIREKNLAPYQNEVNQLKSIISESEGRSRDIEYILKNFNSDMHPSSYKAYLEDEYKMQQDNIRRANERLVEIETMASVLSPEDVAEQRKLVEDMRDKTKQDFDYYMDLYGVTRGTANQGADLSNLQQGIQSITEDTAGAIEAYLNGISQQVYLENSQLAEIKEYLLNFSFDVQLGVLSEILLQLQTSYQTQAAIQSILQGWSNANGMAVRVELQ